MGVAANPARPEFYVSHGRSGLHSGDQNPTEPLTGTGSTIKLSRLEKATAGLLYRLTMECCRWLGLVAVCYYALLLFASPRFLC